MAIEVTLIDHMGTDLTVVNAARVSMAKESGWEYMDENFTPYSSAHLGMADVKLIKYLAKHKHWTPFSHPMLTFRVKAPIPLARQLFKHKVGFTENEISRRYVDDLPTFYTPAQWRKKAQNVKQGSSDEAFFGAELDQLEADYKYLTDYATALYDKWLDRGLCAEQARFFLPQGMETEWYWTGSLSAFARVCHLRLDSHAQWDTRELVAKFRDQIEPLFPHSWPALTEH